MNRISPQGRLTLVETKLWKNSEKHRTVVAQVVDYAKDLARWNLDEFLAAVAKTRTLEGKSSFKDRVKPHVSGDWTAFEDKMLSNLRKGNFLLLIVGDRVSPNVALLSDAIHAAPGLSYTLRLVEMRMFTMGKAPWPLIVVPDVVGRTVEKTRGIVRVAYRSEVCAHAGDAAGSGCVPVLARQFFIGGGQTFSTVTRTSTGRLSVSNTGES